MFVLFNTDALTGLKQIKDETIDLVFTSPTYWKLRNYHHEDQIGQEKSYHDYIDNLIKIFNEVKRALRPTGSCFINIGDTYKNQSMCGIPERLMLKMLDNGWYLRNKIIWQKPGAMPESVKYRFTNDYEAIYFFTKEPKGYYFKQILEPFQGTARQFFKTRPPTQRDIEIGTNPKRNRKSRPNTNGRNRRTVWKISQDAKGGKYQHYATFPLKLAEIVVETACPENSITLDTFAGICTTAVAAISQNKHFVGTEINTNYCKQADRYLTDKLGLIYYSAKTNNQKLLEKIRQSG